MEKANRFLMVKHLKTLLLIAILGGISMGAFAQKLPRNLPRYDRKPVHFGFSLGLNYYDFRIQEIEDLAGLEDYYSVRSTVSPGYTIRIVSNLRLGDFWDLRFCPGFAATERTLTFDVIEPLSDERMEVERKIESSFIEMPVLLKWKSERIKNYRLYVMGGLKYNLDLASKENVDDDRFFKIKKNSYGYEVGFGVDIYFDYFKFSPQIVGSFGLGNLLVDDGTFYIQGIETLQTRAILLNLTFE